MPVISNVEQATRPLFLSGFIVTGFKINAMHRKTILIDDIDRRIYRLWFQRVISLQTYQLIRQILLGLDPLKLGRPFTIKVGSFFISVCCKTNLYQMISWLHQREIFFVVFHPPSEVSLILRRPMLGRFCVYLLTSTNVLVRQIRWQNPFWFPCFT